ncbi:MAG: hypothetical protein NVS2B3_07930 [Vulcanimicrobiaceae bacterium]
MMTRKRRPTLLPAISLAILGALLAIPALSQMQLYAATSEHFHSVTVARGDNLWSIADRYTAPEGNVQETVDRIKATNNLSSGTLAPGQRLRVPE